MTRRGICVLPSPATARTSEMAERSPPNVPPRVTLPTTPGYLSAESEDLGESYLDGSSGRELQLSQHDSSPLSRPDLTASSTHSAELRGSPADGRVRVSAESSASVQDDMAVFRQKIEDAAKVVAPLSQRAESARVAFIAARAALDELHLSKSMLSQQLMYLMTHSEGTASSSEISALQQRIEGQGRALVSASRRHEEAEFVLRCVVRSLSSSSLSMASHTHTVRAAEKQKTILKTRSPESDCFTTSLK